MSYVVPSVLVYQQLATNGGVANVTPDLDAVIIGPCYNVVSYVAGSAASLSLTAALSSPGGSPFTLTNNAITNTVYLGSVKVGQVVDPSTIAMYLNSSLVESKVSYMSGTAGSNVLTIPIFSGVGTAAIGSPTLTSVTNVTQLNPGDIISVVGAGAGATTLTTSILSISGATVTMAVNAGANVTGGAITRVSFNNLNPNSSTLRVEAGDQIVIAPSGTAFVTTVLSTVGSNNVITQINTTDVLPVGSGGTFSVSVRKTFNNLSLPLTYNSYTNYSLTNVTVNASIAINPLPVVSYGTVVSGAVNIAYTALRTDLSGSLIDIDNILTQQGTLGDATDANPLALAVELALANSIGRIMCMAIPTNDLAGYTTCLNFLENSRVYCLVPLTQDVSILSAFQQHVQQMSTPQNAAWRITLVNTVIPAVSYIGQYNPQLVNANSGNNTITLVSGKYQLNSSNSTFVTDGVVPGDTVMVTSAVGTPTLTSLVVQTVVNNQTLIVNSTAAYTAVNFYVQRTLARTDQANIVAANSHSFTSSRVYHIQPDLIGVIVGGVTKYLPGYYAAAAISGLVSGLPAQQSLTNIGVAGIADLQHSNRYFTRAQLSTISAAGTWLLVQEAAGTIPYSRHSLSTDMSVLEYRELQQVKNIDYLSYYFHDILTNFPGRYNITPDTLQVLRATIIAGAKLLQGKTLPKIGPPLLDYKIVSIGQDPVNLDTVNANLQVTMPTVLNYINLYLIY
jgi:hypothetical protein